MTNPAGNGYRGTTNWAASGRPCMNWTDVENYTITAALTTDDISETVNYCRRVPFTEWNGPSCVTIDEAGMVRLERCDVPYCGKPHDFEFDFFVVVDIVFARTSYSNIQTEGQRYVYMVP